MKVVAFLQLYNELENGNLLRCLENCATWADEIFIYDDCSTDGSQQIYLNYTYPDHIICGGSRDFTAELFHKQRLLELCLRSNPNWIGWIDGDAIFDKYITEHTEELLTKVEEGGFDAAQLRNMNLWRSPSYFRLDDSFDDLWHVVFWKNTGRLYYNPIKRLHQRQYPLGINNLFSIPYPQHRLLHYGFATKENIIRKYLNYKALGQHGWSLDRLITEYPPKFKVEKCPRELYPTGMVPADYDSATPPTPVSFEEVKRFRTWQELQNHPAFHKIVGS